MYGNSLKRLIGGSTSLDSYRYCLDHVKKCDRENYLAAIYIQDARLRRAVIALRAFNVELSLVRDLTTDSDRAKVRFHFWSKLVEEIADRQKNRETASEEKLNAYYNYSPVAKELLDLFELVEINSQYQQRLQDLIGARVSSKVLGYKPFLTLSELESYCSKSNGSVYHLASMIADQLYPDHRSKLVYEVSESLGRAHGLSNIIRGIPYNSTKNCCYIPQDILGEYKLTTRDFVQPRLDPQKIAPIIEDLSSRCQNLLNEVHSAQTDLPKHARSLTLTRIAIQSYLSNLRRKNYNVCDPRLLRRNEILPLRLWFSSRLI